MTMAMMKPSTSSITTVITVIRTVTQMACQNTPSVKAVR